MKRTLVVLALLALAAAGVGLSQRNKKAAAAAAERAAKARLAPVPALVTNAMLKTMPVEVATFGTIEPPATVAVKSQITGVLTNVLFAEGQDVKEGDLLFVIDPRGPEAALRQAEAVLARDRVQLENAEREAGREEELFKRNLSAQDARDRAATAADALRATVRADEAAVENARLQVSYCFIRSPLTGRTGSLLVDRGNLVKANDVTLITIHQIRPILATFTLPQAELARIRARLAQAAIPVRAAFPGESSRVETGAVTFIDNAVDMATGTILLKAQFANDDGFMWPGQYVTATIELAKEDRALVVPSRAVMPGQKGPYVYVAARDGTVTNRAVRVSRNVGEESVIADGLADGDTVVVEGQLRIAPGSRIKLPQEPSAAASPSP